MTMRGVVPRAIKWPMQFVGYVILAYAMFVGWQYGIGYRGYMGGIGGAILAFGLVGLAWFGAKTVLGQIAEWLVVRTLTIMARQEALVERSNE